MSPQPGNGVLPDSYEWQVNAACPKIRWIDAITPAVTASPRPSWTWKDIPTAPIPRVVNVDDLVLGNRTAFMPFDLDGVSGMTAGSGKNGKAVFSGDQSAVLPAGLVGPDLVSVGRRCSRGRAGCRVRASQSVQPVRPPSRFESAAGDGGFAGYLRSAGTAGARLLDESPYRAGSHQQVWDGRDGDGRATSSGCVFLPVRRRGPETGGQADLAQVIHFSRGPRGSPMF